ncbi:hepcidin-like isoform X1 [Salarias fasciatus]|uniref:hepcidin-like isoform X1 n=1 Tax=Salarias fasciatus TaxID=181472 RepID=UPI0011764CDD|nr:hepcidin-like isoform X1 [Salarias fasciatus]
MKTFRVAVAVAVVLTVICVQQTSSVQLTEEQELEEPVSSEVQAAAEETAVDSWKTVYDKSLNRRFKCRICCNCCLPGYCGLCCKF